MCLWVSTLFSVRRLSAPLVLACLYHSRGTASFSALSTWWATFRRSSLTRATGSLQSPPRRQRLGRAFFWVASAGLPFRTSLSLVFFFLACFAPSLRPIKTWANSSSPTAAVCAHVTGRCCYLRWPLGSSWVAVTDAFDSCLFILAGWFVGLPVACCVCGSGCRCTFWAACLSSSCIVTACHVAGLVCVLVVDGLTSLVSFCAWPSSILPVSLFSWCNLCCWHWFCVPLAVCLCRVVLCA